jgi:hypothetical protein
MDDKWESNAKPFTPEALAVVLILKYGNQASIHAAPHADYHYRGKRTRPPKSGTRR